ncbi:MAG TPA: pilus assembly protein PilM [Caldisericia bacterium]|nr:pilus assembly protein PilM [Caldisericia bacterium]HPF48238.1 pilus assembly protein PilM [Caldisericia bacterium]HPI83826.1 pilus assembly protein PilM [Caldisericia bacterium]HPQ92691.1 pilus assembly protein PilM [Caldisericia bacterium]HRV74211.1 pilus assembly protein PilM [Caldisericia bacterium]
MKYGPIGIQIDKERIRIAQLSVVDNNPFSVVEMITIPTPEGSVSNGFVKTPRVLGDSIDQAIKTSKFFGRKAIIAIPSEILQIHLVTVPESSNLDRSIASRLSQMSFEHPEQLTFDYKIINNTAGVLKAIVAVTNKHHIAKLKEMAEEANLKLVGTDLEMLSIFRLTKFCYKTANKPIMVALFTKPRVKLAIFDKTVLTQLSTTSVFTTDALAGKSELPDVCKEFLREYHKTNTLSDTPTLFLSGLPEPNTSLEKELWEGLSIPVTSIRWCEAFNVSETYPHFREFIKRFGAFSCCIGLSMADMTLPDKHRTPIIADVRVQDFDSGLLEFARPTEEKAL